MTGQARTVRAGAFHPDPIHRPEAGQPPVQLGVTRRCRRERLDTQHPAVRVDRGRDMNIRVRIDSTRDRARALYDGHRHPFCFNGSRGGTHVPGRRPWPAAALTASSTPSGTGRAHFSQPTARPTRTQRTSVLPTSQTDPRATPNVATTTTTMVDPPTSALASSLGNLWTELLQVHHDSGSRCNVRCHAGD